MQRDEAERIETARLCINMAIEVLAVTRHCFQQAGMPLASVVRTMTNELEVVRGMSQPEFRAARETMAK